MTPAQAGPDRLIGERIRARRFELGLTQDQLAARLGLSYQQIQKYESGASRITAVRLLEIAATLDVPVDRFIGGLRGAASLAGSPDAAGHAATARVVADLSRSLKAIDNEAVRAAVTALLRAVAERAAPS